LIWTRRGTIVAAVAAVIGLGTIALMIWPPHGTLFRLISADPVARSVVRKR
jgi:uncharacterized membrane protein YwaF